MTRREAMQTTCMLDQLTILLRNSADENQNRLQAREDAESIRRISMTLHRWHELECGVDGGGIERDSIDNKPWWYSSHANKRTHIVADREAGALKRLAAIMQRYPSLTSYVQGDPRGCALYILRPGDVPAGEKADAYYSCGLAVHQ